MNRVDGESGSSVVALLVGGGVGKGREKERGKHGVNF